MAKVTYDFSDEVALVTGAASGMGLATARAFARAGAKVVIADVASDTLKVAERYLRTSGYEATGVVCDVSDDDQVEALVEDTLAAYGRLDVAFNNAGIMMNARPITELDVADYNRVMDVNLRGVFSAMKCEIRAMRRLGQGGAIVNNSSLAGLVGAAGRSQYAAAKHGILGMTKSVAMEVAAEGIRVNAICPGTIETPMVERMAAANDLDIAAAAGAVPIRRTGTAEEIAQSVLWLCSEGASYVIGQPLAVDGGHTIQ